MRHVGKASRAYNLYRNEKMERLGISGSQGTFLLAVIRHPGVSQEELADRLVFNKSSVARKIAELEAKGFVFRRRSETDKRQFCVFATEEGAKLAPEIIRINQEFFSRLKESFTEEEWEQLGFLSEKLSLCAKEAIKEL